MATGTVFNRMASIRLTVPNKIAGIPKIRKLSRYFLQAMIDDVSKVDDVLLVISELLTNALLHSGDDRITFVLAVCKKTAKVTVIQKSGEFMFRKQDILMPPLISENGRGLQIINSTGDLEITNKNGLRVTATVNL